MSTPGTPPATAQQPTPDSTIRTATRISTRSIIFSSSLYNSNATLSDDPILPATALPVLTPPLTPMQWTHRALPQPAELALASEEEEKQDEREEAESEAAENDAQQSTLRSRRVTRSLSRKQRAVPATVSSVEEKETAVTSTVTQPTGHEATSTNLTSSSPTTQPNTTDTSSFPSSATPPHPDTHRIHPSQLVPSYPFHRKSQPSALSTEAPPVSLRGLYNLAGITLFTLTARLVLENVLKYGWLIRMNLVFALSEDWERTWPCLLIAFFVCCVSPVLSWAIERYGGEGEVWERWLNGVHVLHIVAVFVVPQAIITATRASVLSGLVLVMVVMVMTMKLISFAHVCYDIRHRIRLERQGKLPQPTPTTPDVRDVSALHPILPDHYSIELSHVLYFMLAPTLIYQLSYPKSSPTGHIRVAFLVRRVIELVFCVILQLLIIEQYLYPTVRNAMQSMSAIGGGVSGSGLHYLAIVERILKIALPNGLVWLLMFYALFHSWLNILAELMNFGDRLFYKEWWNCKSLDQYWNSWNLPVHNFVMRHLYAPLLRSGISVWLAQLTCFLASAVAHELLVAVPLHTLQWYMGPAFWGMLAQVPLIYFTRWIVRRFKQPVWSNCVFWFSFLVAGQPLLILLYAHAVLSRSAQMASPHTVIVPVPAMLDE